MTAKEFVKEFYQVSNTDIFIPRKKVDSLILEHLETLLNRTSVPTVPTETVTVMAPVQAQVKPETVKAPYVPVAERIRWTKPEVNRLEDMARNGMSPEEISKILGKDFGFTRTWRAIEAKRIKLKIRSPTRLQDHNEVAPLNHNLKWTATEDDFLRRNHLRLPSTELARRLNRDIGGIRGRKYTLNLRKREESQNKKWNTVATDEVFERALTFLRTAPRPQNTSQMVEALGIAHSAFARHVGDRLKNHDNIFVERKRNGGFHFAYIGDDGMTKIPKKDSGEYLRNQTQYYIGQGINPAQAKITAQMEAGGQLSKQATGITQAFEDEFDMPASLLLGLAQHIFKNNKITYPELVVYFKDGTWERFVSFLLKYSDEFMTLAGSRNGRLIWEGRDLILKGKNGH